MVTKKMLKKKITIEQLIKFGHEFDLKYIDYPEDQYEGLAVVSEIIGTIFDIDSEAIEKIIKEKYPERYKDYS